MLIACVVNPVMGWSDENILDRRRQFFNIFRVDPELVQHCDLMADKEDKWIKTYHHHRNKEDELNMLRPA